MSEETQDSMDLGRVPPSKGRRAMDEAVKLAKALGAGAAGLVAKIQYARSPQAMRDALDENLEKNTARRGEVSARLEAVHGRIVALKGQYEAAAPARKRTLQMELRALMGEYGNLENEFGILIENEEVLGKVKGRFMETLAYDLRGIKEKQIDKVADGIEERAGDAEEVLDAVGDLDRAGRRRDREGAAYDFEAELAAFGEAGAAAESGAELPDEAVGEAREKGGRERSGEPEALE